MAFDGVRSLDWAAHNEVRNYPLVPSASRESDDQLFKLPQAVVLAVYVFLPWDRDVHPSRFFLSQVSNLGDGFGVALAYQPPGDAAIPVATASIPRDTSGRPVVRQWVPEEGWEDIAGSVTLGNLNTLGSLPLGVFDFGIAATQLEVDCIRPSARGLSGVRVENGQEVFEIATGLINLRAGENVRLRAEQTSPGQYDIWIDAVDTSDLAKDCGCGDVLTDPIRSINLIPPNANGNIDLVGAKCLEFDASPGVINVVNPCSEPCCGCAEAEALQAAIDHFGPQLTTLANFAPRLALQMDRMEFIVSVTNLDDACPAPPPPPMQTTTTTVSPE